MLRALKEWLANNVEIAATRGPHAARLRFETEARVKFPGGETVSLRDAEARLPLLVSRDERFAAARAIDDAAADFTDRAAEFHSRAAETAGALGFAGYVEMHTSLSGIDFDALAAAGARFLDETEDVYADLLRWTLKRRLPDAADAPARHDLLALFRYPHLQGAFPRGELERTARKWCAAWLLDPGADGAVKWDLEDRPKKRARAFCAPIEVPDRVVLSVRPRGGFADYSALFHELGHALHFASIGTQTPGETPFEVRRCGDLSTAEAFAYVFHYLLYDWRWLKRHLDLDRDADLVRELLVYELFRARGRAARLPYELELYRRGPRPALADMYRDALGRATRCDWPAALYLWDVDPRFYSARYLRAWMLETRLFETMREKFDEDYWRNPRASAWLAKLWNRGMPDAAVLAKDACGGAELDLSAAARRLTALAG
jgi:hypothetical protein